jgi:N-acyl-L-homoserine lactone synthetase
MIDLVHPLTDPESGGVLPEIFRFRHRVFIEYAGWDIPSHHGLELDQFDTADALYLLCRDEDSVLRGMCRLIPSTAQYMIKELWADLLGGEAPPSAPEIWEISRFGIDPSLESAERELVSAQIVLGCLEFGLACGIEQYYAVMPTLLARRVVSERGWPFSLCGPTRRLGSYRVAAIRMDVTQAAQQSVQACVAQARRALTPLAADTVRERDSLRIESDLADWASSARRRTPFAAARSGRAAARPAA